MESACVKRLNADVLEFVIFVVENVAQKLEMSGAAVYHALSCDSDLLSTYVVPSHDVLHAQGKDYIVNDVVAVMRRKGVAL